MTNQSCVFFNNIETCLGKRSYSLEPRASPPRDDSSHVRAAGGTVSSLFQALVRGWDKVSRAELKMRKANVELCKQRKEEDSAPLESLPYVIQVLVPFIVNFAWVKTLVSVKALDSLSGECP